MQGQTCVVPFRVFSFNDSHRDHHRSSSSSGSTLGSVICVSSLFTTTASYCYLATINRLVHYNATFTIIPYSRLLLTGGTQYGTECVMTTG